MELIKFEFQPEKKMKSLEMYLNDVNVVNNLRRKHRLMWAEVFHNALRSLCDSLDCDYDELSKEVKKNEATAA